MKIFHKTTKPDIPSQSICWGQCSNLVKGSILSISSKKMDLRMGIGSLWQMMKQNLDTDGLNTWSCRAYDGQT
jgi:hypothetical protein